MNFKFHYVVEYDYVPENAEITDTVKAFIEAADEVTSFNPEAWSVSLFSNQIIIGFDSEHFRDRFIKIYEAAFRSEPNENALVAAIKRVRGRSLHQMSD